MKYNIENFLSMVMAVIAKCRANQTVVDASVSFKAAFTLLVNRLASVQSWQQIKNESTVGITILKKNKRKAAVDAGVTIAQAMAGYAYDNNLTEMQKNVTVKPSKLLNGRDTVCLDKLKYIYSVAFANKAELEDYGVEEGQITALEGLITAYENSIPALRTHRNRLKNATAQIKKECKEIADHLTYSMDPGIEQFKQASPTFYNEFLNSRAILDLKGPSTGVKGTVRDSVSKIKLRKANIIVVEGNTNTYSSKRGSYSFKKLAPGFYTIIVKLAGYNDLTLTGVEVKAGLLTDMDIQLQKIEQQNIAA